MTVLNDDAHPQAPCHSFTFPPPKYLTPNAPRAPAHVADRQSPIPQSIVSAAMKDKGMLFPSLHCSWFCSPLFLSSSNALSILLSSLYGARLAVWLTLLVSCNPSSWPLESRSPKMWRDRPSLPSSSARSSPLVVCSLGMYARLSTRPVTDWPPAMIPARLEVSLRCVTG